jgi:hypothetical protein
MQSELFTAFDAYMNGRRAAVVAALGKPRVPFATPAAVAGAPAPSGVVDIANAIRGELERRYATSMDAATTSAPQAAARAPRVGTGAGQNVFDAYSVAERRRLAAGQMDLPIGVAYWLFDNAGTGAIINSHHYSSGEDPPNGAFHRSVAAAYAAASTLAGVAAPATNADQLIDYRLTSWNEQGTGSITLLSAYNPDPDAAKAERVGRWDVFRSGTHESLHLRAHPAFTAAIADRNNLREGFTEMFTASALDTDVLPRVRAGTAEPLRRIVEGGTFTPAPDATIIHNRVTPSEYIQPRQAAERVRDGGTPTGGTAHAGVGEAAVRAAFFEGHVEFLGLTPTGDPLPGLLASGARKLVHIPLGLKGLNDLAARTGVPRATIEADNPGITDALPLGAVLTGCRDHLVVVAGGVPETRANIAAQNGVSEKDLVNANPDVVLDSNNDWPTLNVGQRILIPVH